MTEPEAFSSDPKRRKLTEDQRGMIYEKHRQDPKMSQKQIAEWAAIKFDMDGLSQNTVSRILSAAKKNKQTGKLTHAQRALILKEYQHNPKITQKQLSEFAQCSFNLEKAPSQSTISAIINQKLKSMSTDVPITDDSKKRLRTVQFPQLEEALRLWVLQCEAKRIAISGALIQEQARRFANKLLIPEEIQPQFSSGWLVKFQQRHGFRSVRFFGESGSADVGAIEENLPKMIEEIEKYRRCDVFNMDETGLLYRMAPDRTIASKNLNGSKKDKARITIALTANADGSEKLPPLFIGHFGKPRAFGKKSPQQLGFLYKFNKSAWMTSAIFQDWLLDLDKRYRMQQRKVLLLLDNAPTHIVGSLELTSLKIIFLPPNTTSKIQPLDAGIIAAFKKRYRSYQLQNALDLYTLGTKDIFKIDILQGIRWASAAWDCVSSETIRNCWRHAGLIKSSQHFSTKGECNLDASLDKMMKDLHLQDSMTVSEMVNNPDEAEDLHVVLEEDEIIEIVTCKVIEEDEAVPAQDSEDEDDATSSLDNRIHILQQAIVILNRDPEQHCDSVRDIRTLIRNMKEEKRLEREKSLNQPTIECFFSKTKK